MKTGSERYIEVGTDVAEKLAERLGCTAKMVYMALTYRKDTELARKIRYTAVKYFGGVPMIHVPECTTWHDTTEDGRQIMRQVFNNGATLTVDKKTGEVWITNRKGEAVEYRNSITLLADLFKMQVIAESL